MFALVARVFKLRPVWGQSNIRDAWPDFDYYLTGVGVDICAADRGFKKLIVVEKVMRGSVRNCADNGEEGLRNELKRDDELQRSIEAV